LRKYIQKKSNKLFYKFLLLFILPLSLSAQPFPKDYFRSPVDFPYHISGTFAEFRRDHLHSGLDIPAPMHSKVYAVADGWVARIRIQPAGYGRVIYIAHPNGYMSVYAHIDRFAPYLEAYLVKKQYLEETYEIDFYPEKEELPVKKSDVIASSGNSGMSTGPHLHFEFRKMAGEKPTNPLLFGLPVIDNLKPIFKTIRIYTANDEGHLLSNPAPQNIPVSKGPNGYKLKSGGTITVPPKFIIGVQAQDLDGSGNRNGLYGLEVLFDGKTWYKNNMDHFSFTNFRAVNSLTDYSLYLKSGKFFQITRVSDCDGIGIYSDVENKGVFDVSDLKPHQVMVKIRDYLGNASTLEFSVKANNTNIPIQEKNNFNNSNYTTLPCNKNNTVDKPGIRIFFPEGVLFDSLDFHMKQSAGPPSLYSDVFTLQDAFTPLNDNIIVSIAPRNVPKELLQKTCIVKVGEKGGYAYVKSGYNNGRVSCQTRKFGSFAVALDQTPPYITAVSSVVKKTKKGRKKTIATPKNTLKFRIGDNLSGIDNYCGYINDKWVLMEFSKKGSLLSYTYDEHLHPGVNTFVLVVTDKVGNESRFETIITR
jgi:hypothetical protein